ncbi:MAG: hypothetical protein KBS97_01760 [Firmicutes bacterium]|nr:hypothetical protein [Candidatus Fiminaster equi]
MAGSDLVNKFTNEQYLTRKEIADALGTNLIDQIWRENLLYRREKSVELPIVDNAKFHFTLTQTQKVIAMYGEISERINTCINAFEKLNAGKIAKYTLTHNMIKTALMCVAKLNKIDVSEITIQNIMEHQCYDETYKVVVNYYNALEELSRVPYEQFDDSFLGKYLSILRGEEELTSFYRMSDKNPASARYLIGAEYNNGVQFELIENMMSDLISFANDDGQPLLIKLMGVIYMVNYIKPFDDLNLEIGMLIAKSILAHSGLSSAAVYVPIESILLNNQLFDEISREIQKSHDFTYMFLRGGEVIKTSFNTIIDRIIQVNAKALENTVNAGDNEKKFKEEFGFIPEKPIFDKPEPKPAPVPQPVVQPAPVPKPVPAPVHNPVPAPAVHLEPARKVELKQTSDLSEKELKSMELDILQSDPYIKKGQAHFYVRHCTKGRFYTIQEYKKFEGCVYETARTSMDNLALRGYYRREQIKNKFVYTPIDKE